jgi:D-alanine-D-alanine ligase-like ATP-grasp enzyme
MGMTPEMLRDELEFLRENRFREQLLAICELARIEYGRIDFGVDKDGRLAIWEINTHPTLPRIRGEDLLKVLSS